MVKFYSKNTNFRGNQNLYFKQFKIQDSKFRWIEKMGFSELKLKEAYDSVDDLIVETFLVPVLTNARKYYRITGYFASSALAVAARGLFPFIKNNGEMRIITSINFHKRDLKAIKDGLVKPEKIIESIIIDELENIDNNDIRDRIRLLAWMVATNHLEIKIAIRNSDIDNNYLDISSRGLFHQKVGILFDEENRILSFSGSINETKSGWIHNIEEFKVFKDWEPGEKKYVESDLNKFFRYWDNKADKITTYSIPEAAKKHLISMAPRDLNELKHLEFNSFASRIHFRSYQEMAIDEWINNAKKGIFEMATGTGKTFTAIGALQELIKEKKRLLVVITVPFIHLTLQWKNELSKFDFKASEYHSQSKDDIDSKLFNFKHKLTNYLIIVTVHNTFSHKKFREKIEKINDDILLIADECHWLGAPQRKKGLSDVYSFRLGLSATPFRWLDEVGTNELLDYFNGIIFKFPLDKAIPEFLTPYKYHPIFVNFNSEELERFKKFSEIIATHVEEKKYDYREKIDIIRVKRSKLVQNALNKFIEFEKLLDSFSRDINHCLVYCSPEQIKIVQETINKKGYLQHKITEKEDLTTRNRYISKFAEGEYKFLTAIKCLDEGVDIPATKIAILMSNSGNPREFIQRRGRILRKAPNKEYAIIYDFIVMPPFSEYVFSADHKTIEYQFIKKEFDRYKEFGSLAINSSECLETIKQYEKQMR